MQVEARLVHVTVSSRRYYCDQGWICQRGFGGFDPPGKLADP